MTASRTARHEKEPIDLKRTRIAAQEVGISEGMVRRFLERKQLRRWKLNSLTFVSVSELRGLIRPEAE